MVEITAAALIPFVANLKPTVAAILGVVIVILEGLQYINQYHRNWVTYRSTCEALRHEKYLYIARSGPYDQADDDLVFKELVSRVESLISAEHSKWVTSREESRKQLEP